MINRSLALLPILLWGVGSAFAAEYPAREWAMHDRQGWSEPLLAAARKYASNQKTLAVMVVQNGRVVDQWGPVDQKILVRSVRKSFLSALYGIHLAEGRINLGMTLGELGIDDHPPALTAIEKQATILDLLRSRSGVYHETNSETKSARAGRPSRGSHPPGSFWYYNNWDFNALGAIFQQVTGANIFEDFEKRIAKPIGMNDFTAADGRLSLEPEGSNLKGDSKFPHYLFFMTARDMARFGYLFLRNGKWGDRQVVPAEWVARSTTPYSALRFEDGYGKHSGYALLWWTDDWGYMALGQGGHVIAVIPSKDLVIVHRVVYDPPREDIMDFGQIDPLIRMYINAAPDIRR